MFHKLAIAIPIMLFGIDTICDYSTPQSVSYVSDNAQLNEIFYQSPVTSTYSINSDLLYANETEVFNNIIIIMFSGANI